MPIMPISSSHVGPVSNLTIHLQGDDSYFAVAPSELHAEATTFGTYGTGNGNLNYPYGAAVTADGSEIWVCDGSSHRVARFQLDGTWVGSFGTNGSGDGQFSTPRDIAFDLSGNAYVADFGNNRIQKFNSSGVYQSQWSTGANTFPMSIVYDRQNAYLWTALNGTSVGQIKAYNVSGVTQVDFGVLSYKPYSVAVDRRGRRVYVGVVNSVLRYNIAGLFQGSIFADILTSGPAYVDIDDAEIIFVCETTINTVWKGLRTGEVMSNLCVSGSTGTLAVDAPMSVTKYGEFMYIVDNGNHKVHKVTSGTKANAFGFRIDYQGNIQHTGYLIYTGS